MDLFFCKFTSVVKLQLWKQVKILAINNKELDYK